MPLHLLGKKSWNVYNVDNVARVRRDEAEAKAREEEEERRMQEVDAERRIQGLRTSSLAAQKGIEDAETRRRESVGRGDKKRRRLAGEDDTDRDIRYAKRTSTVLSESRAVLLRKESSDAPLTDRNGHISLFPEERSRKTVAKNPEVEAEQAKKKREYEDQYMMRFSNAAGFKQGLIDPWYSSLNRKDTTLAEEPGKDVWGNEDPRRKEREKMRKDDDDPLVFMRKGVQELRRVEKEKRSWEEARYQEERELKRMWRKSHHRSSRPQQAEKDDELDGFRLDTPIIKADAASSRDHRERHRIHRRHEHHHSHTRRNRRSLSR